MYALLILGLTAGYAMAAKPAGGLKWSGLLGQFLRWLIVTVFLLSYFSKLTVLVVSTPPGQLPPRNVILKKFYVSNLQIIQLFFAEMWVICYTLICLYVLNQMTLGFLLPVLIAFFAYLGVAFVKLDGHTRLYAILCIGASYVRQSPLHLLDPLAGTVHTLVVVVVLIFRTYLPNQAVLIVYCVHSFLLLLGLLERTFYGRLPWRTGCTWFVGPYLALYCCATELGLSLKAGEHHMHGALLWTSVTWLCAQLVLAFTLNWQDCVLLYRQRYQVIRMRRSGGLREQYRHWQNRNAVFRMSVDQ